MVYNFQDILSILSDTTALREDYAINGEYSLEAIKNLLNDKDILRLMSILLMHYSDLVSRNGFSEENVQMWRKLFTDLKTGIDNFLLLLTEEQF